MTPAEVIRIVQLVEQGISLALQAGITVSTLVADIQEARAEGRALTDEQIDGYARGAATAVAKL